MSYEGIFLAHGIHVFSQQDGGQLWGQHVAHGQVPNQDIGTSTRHWTALSDVGFADVVLVGGLGMKPLGCPLKTHLSKVESHLQSWIISFLVGSMFNCFHAWSFGPIEIFEIVTLLTTKTCEKAREP